MKIGLIDADSKIPNLALMKLSAYHKFIGNEVILNPSSPIGLDKAYCSVIFEKNRHKAEVLRTVFPDIEFGGTGWDLKTELPAHIENIYGLITVYIVSKRFTRA